MKPRVAIVLVVLALGASVMAYLTGKQGIGDIFGVGPVAAGTVANEFPSLAGATGWLNSQPLSPEQLRGKVVVVEFWTYSCINWRRTMPFVRAWADKYRDQGLVVIGVHTPEFSFEKNVDNIRVALKETDVRYPVAIDSDYRIWNAFSNEYWPALYIIDAKGRIRGSHFGEGEYDKSERLIQKLLSEAGNRGGDGTLVAVEGRGAEAAPDFADLRTSETYVGTGRGSNFTSVGGAMTGDWTVRKESAVLNKAGGRIAFQFHARDLHLVMGPGSSANVRFRVLIDGQPPGIAHGVDVDEQGYGTMSYPKMFQLIRQARPIEDRRFEIEFLDAGAEAFSFTFG